MVPLTRIICCMLAVLLSAVACNQHPEKPAAAIQKANKDTLVTFMQHHLRPLLIENNAKKAKQILDSLKPFVEEQHSFSSTYLWLRHMMFVHQLQRNEDSIEYYTRKALALAIENDSTRQIIAGKLELSDILNSSNKSDSALMHVKDAYFLAKQKDTAKLAGILFKLVTCYAYIGNLEQYREYCFEGLRLSEKNLHYKPLFLLCINSYYSSMHMKDSALWWYHRYIEKDTSMNNPMYKFMSTENTGLMLSYQDKDEEALKYQLQALDDCKQAEDKTSVPYYNLGVTYHKLKRYREAEESLKASIKHAHIDRLKEVATDSWNEIAKVYASQQKWEQAFTAKDSAYESYKRYVDSSFAGKAKEIETRYAVKSKDEEIRTLAFANEANRKIGVQQKTIIFIFAGAFVMAAVLGFALWRRRKLSEKLRQAELEQRLLRSQMEPHFIFNTLSVLQSYIRNNESEKAVRYLNQFARLLRVTLENSRESFVPLDEEVTALENYLSLQSMRFEGVFDYEVQAWPGYEEEGLLIPPMLLQPFAENAILHGMKQLQHKGHIAVSIQKEANVLRCIIEDNGTGLQSGSASQPGKSSLSTTITRERLEILSRQTGYAAGITITNRGNEHSGTTVILTIPYRKAKPYFTV
ncbi:histidine kinase [Pseudoflavitalea sp. G-6-1-2]|uniref:histidine kinase n=1 Tax=Pseudoflavitalea sp. G-6-1-2 TaxID=2728841 RepID=UPI00146A672E|nr:histidine kinase [Pseudoflavitalea sp. G-6-1-2]NML24097.1 histidine kinase [Pseudoflavitalea sp. G-6-1-2]